MSKDNNNLENLAIGGGLALTGFKAKNKIEDFYLDKLDQTVGKLKTEATPALRNKVKELIEASELKDVIVTDRKLNEVFSKATEGGKKKFKDVKEFLAFLKEDLPREITKLRSKRRFKVRNKEVSKLKDSVLTVGEDIAKKVAKKIVRNHDPGVSNAIATSTHISMGDNYFKDKSFLQLLKGKPGDLKGSFTLAHELGHKMEPKNIVTRVAKKGYGLGMIGPKLAIIQAALGGKEGFEKNVTDYAPEIGALSTLPTLIEEGRASRNAINLAKKTGVSPKDILKGKKNLGKAFATYLSLPIGGYGAGSLVRYLRKKISNYKD